MQFVFIDEQYDTGERGSYTAIVAAIFSENVINEFRREFVAEYAKILHPTAQENNTIHVSLPVLHGSDFLPDYDDDVKIAVFELISNLSVKYNVKFIRTGYYDKSLFFLKSKPNAKRVGFCIHNLDYCLTDYFNENYIYLYELDRENLDKTDYNDNYIINRYGQEPNLSFSIDIEQRLGRFYCNKENYCMYMADVVGHWLLKSDNGRLRDVEFVCGAGE
ncbi:MAG: hypothetical protein GY948_11575 [Alphaproteobacteria bacterium]|nr:hypothetical protein [Alphaproteobacteria bacterium]